MVMSPLLVFINTVHNSFLDWWNTQTPSAHPVFGKVTDGMAVVTAIENGPTGYGDRPREPMQIISVERI